MMPITNDQRKLIMGLTGWRESHFGLWDDGAKLHNLIELDSRDLLMMIVKKVCFKYHFEGNEQQNFWILYITNGDGTLRRELGEGTTDVEALQNALVKIADAK